MLVLNGVDVDTGHYLTPQLALADVAGAPPRDPPPPPGVRELRKRPAGGEDRPPRAPQLALADVAGALRGDPTPPPGVRELRKRRADDEDHLGVVYGRDPQDLASVGWGVVVPPDLDPAVLEALEPLLRLREEQA